MTNLEDEDLKWYTEFIKNKNQIGMVIRKKNGIDYIDAAAIALAINESSGETIALVKADHVNISATNTAHLLAGSIVYDANGKLVLKDSSGAGIYIERQGGSASFGIWDRGNLTGGVMVQQINGQSLVKISGDVIDISSLVLNLNAQQVTISADRIDINGLVTKLGAEQIACVSIHTTGGSNLFEGHNSFPDTVNMLDLTYSGTAVSWQSQTVVTSVGSSSYTKNFKLADDSTWNHKVITDVNYNNTTIHYLGS